MRSFGIGIGLSQSFDAVMLLTRWAVGPSQSWSASEISHIFIVISFAFAEQLGNGAFLQIVERHALAGTPVTCRTG